MLALVVALAGWALFFPVPLGWAVRLGLTRALPADQPLRVALESATFRWRWGAPTLAVELRGVDVTAQGRPLARWRELMVEVPKAGLWQRQFAPAKINLRDPFITVDQTAEGALALLASPPTAAPGAPPDLAMLAPVLPAPGAATIVVVEGAALQLRNAAGEVRLPFGEIRLTLTRRVEGPLGLELEVPLPGETATPRLTVRGTLDLVTRKGDFSLALPTFSTAAIPRVPGAPQLPFQGTVALDVAGHFDLARRSIADIAGGVVVSQAEVALPSDFAAEKIRVDRLELRGRVDVSTQHVVLETGRMRLGALDINVAELDVELGDRPKGRWRFEISGLKGAEMRRLLGAAPRARLPLSAEAIDVISLERLTLAGSAEVARDAAGVWSAQTFRCDGRAALELGHETLVSTWSAQQTAQGGDVTLEFSLPDFMPGRWPAPLLAGTPAGAIDVPLSLAARAVVSATGEPRSARLALTGAAGTVKSLQAGMPPLEVRRIEVRAESERFDRAWRLPIARLELANGAGVELADAHAEFSPSQIAVAGAAKATNLPGQFLALWLPADAWAPLTSRNLPPLEVAIDELTLRFKAAAAARPAGGWQPKSVAAEGGARIRLHAAQLGIDAHLTLPEGGSQIDATVTLSEFQPAQIGLVVGEGLTTDAFDFPVSLRASARVALDGKPTDAGLLLRVGTGRFKATPAFGGVAVPVQGLTLDAHYAPGAGRVDLKLLRLEAGGLRLDLTDVTATTASPHTVAGHVELAPFALRPLLALWPAQTQPELRSTVESSLRGGEFLGARFDWAVKLDPAAAPALSISRFTGEARLAAIDATHAAVPGPIAVGGVTVAIDYPRATAELRDVAVPGARLAFARAQVDRLDQPVPTANLTAKFETDLAAANRAWKFTPDDLVTGTIGGEMTSNAPFDLESAMLRVALDLERAEVKLPGFAKTLPGTMAAELRVAHPLANDRPLTADFSLETAAWLGAPLRLAGRATLAVGDHRPEHIELTTYEHGRTRLRASLRQPTATHREISVTGPYLNMVPLLRAGLAAADALAARPVAPAAVPTNAVPASAAPATTLKIDASIGEIEFGPGRNARAFELHSRLDRNWPTDFTLTTAAGADDALSATLNGPAERQVFKLSIGDASSWVQTLAAPWSEAPPAPGQFGSLIVQLAKVPTMVTGGAVAFDAEVRRGEPEWLIGRFQLRRATLIRAPHVLQLLALKSGRSLQDSPKIEDFSVGRLTLSRTSLSVADTAFIGSGLIDRIKVKSATYGLVDEALKVDGEYFGVGFDILGTRADPKIFLKDSNKLIRAIGSRNEFDFDTPAPPPKPAAPKP